jgi:hypothetical protein
MLLYSLSLSWVSPFPFIDEVKEGLSLIDILERKDASDKVDTKSWGGSSGLF